MLRVIDISGTTGPYMLARSSLTMPAGGGKLFVGNAIAYVAAGNGNTGGFATADVSNPDSPLLISGVDANNVEGRAVVANGSGLAVAVGTVGQFGGGGAALDVLNVSDPSNTGVFLTRFPMPAGPFSVAIGAGIAFVADSTAGLQVVNYRSFDNQGVAPSLTVVPPIDVDTNAPGIQVEEGSLITLGAQVMDDVQVRNVELLLNGQVVRNDVSFPWDLTARAALECGHERRNAPITRHRHRGQRYHFCRHHGHVRARCHAAATASHVSQCGYHLGLGELGLFRF